MSTETLDQPIPYKLTELSRKITLRRARAFYCAVFTVAFGLGTFFGLVLSSRP